jgi:purine nucleoside phosphorylase
VLEAIEARALGLEIVGLSCLTNYAAGLRAQPLLVVHPQHVVSGSGRVLRFKGVFCHIA